jgi:hypothetical protein
LLDKVNNFLKVNLKANYYKPKGSVCPTKNEPKQQQTFYLKRERGCVGKQVSRQAYLRLGIDREIEGRNRYRET